MVGFVAGLLASAAVKIASQKLSSAITEQVGLAWKFGKYLEDIKGTMESIAAVLNDAEKQSVREESVLLWLKRLKNAAEDISDMMDYYQDPDTQRAEKMPAMFSCVTAGHKKMIMANKIKNMKTKLRKINDDGKRFKFTSSTAGSQMQRQDYKPETTSYVNEAEIFGRDGEKKEITELLSSSQSKDEVMVLPIYGLGGIGKSTLAQLVYNDTKLGYHRQAWVYVSQDFDLKKIGRSIVSQLQIDVYQDFDLNKIGRPIVSQLQTAGQHSTNELQLIQNCLNDVLRLLPQDEKILIILDDIWEKDDFKLKALKDMLDKKGRTIHVIVTTRYGSIADKICTKNKPYELKALKDDICWDIIKMHSGFEDKSNKGKLVPTGLEIAKKCGGVALAAQALGYTLKQKDDLQSWREINDSDMWNESSGVDDSQHNKVLSSLKLSYERMLPILRLCFSYCAIFPKGYDINKDDLIYQWISLNFIEKPSDGEKCIQQLLGMSFLQHSKFPPVPLEHVATRYNMHDLARLVLDDELIVIDATKNWNARELEYCRYVLLENYDGEKRLSDILPKKVRALHFSSTSKLGPHDGPSSFAKRLETLDFSGCSNIILPSSHGQLKQLRCLISPKVQNEKLPDYIAELPKLQYLNLHGSSLISAIPESIGKLGCLLYLCLSGCSGILKVPESLGELKSLMHLDMSNCFRITVLPDSLGNLKKLQHLDLSRCSGVKEVPESFGALKSLRHLDLSYCSGITGLSSTLGHLTNLQHLDLSSCSNIAALPESLGGLSQLQYVNLTFCHRIKSLPEAIGNLVDLNHLNLQNCVSIKELPRSFKNLRNLVHLDFSSCCYAKGLPEALCGLTALENLNMSELQIVNDDDDLCIPYMIDAIRTLTNLKYLDLGALHWAPDFGTLTNLEHLDLRSNRGVVSISECIGNLKSCIRWISRTVRI